MSSWLQAKINNQILFREVLLYAYLSPINCLQSTEKMIHALLTLESIDRVDKHWRKWHHYLLETNVVEVFVLFVYFYLWYCMKFTCVLYTVCPGHLMALDLLHVCFLFSVEDHLFSKNSVSFFRGLLGSRFCRWPRQEWLQRWRPQKPTPGIWRG